MVLQHNDLAGIPNLTFTYTGPLPITGLTISGFSVQSTSNMTTTKDFVGQNTKTADGSTVTSIGDVTVAAVPEPTSNHLDEPGSPRPWLDRRLPEHRRLRASLQA